MSLPEPEAGLVIRYAYLWKSEHDQGREEGLKDRPCTIVLKVSEGRKNPRVLVLPITHTQPDDTSLAIQIPAAIKRHLGLDWERSWIVLTEANEFTWPGPDLRPQPGGDLSSVAYGFLPPRLFGRVQAEFVALIKRGAASRVPRTE